MSSHRAAPRGLLRVSAPVSFGTLHLSPLIVGFLRQYGHVRIELDLNDRAVDLVAEGYDMAVRIGILRDSTLVARKLTNLRLMICASPGYLRHRTAPHAIEDLKDHDCLLYGPDRAVSWIVKIGGAFEAIQISGVYRTNNGELIRGAARSATVGALTDYLAAHFQSMTSGF